MTGTQSWFIASPNLNKGMINSAWKHENAEQDIEPQNKLQTIHK